MSPPSSVKSVLFVTYHFPPEIGGIQTRIARYIRELRRRGIRVSVLALSSRRDVASQRIEGAQISMSSGSLRFFLRNAAFILRTTFSDRVDVIHVVTGSSTFVGIFSLIVGRLKRIHCVVSFFGREQFETSGLTQRALLPLSLSLATSITVNSPHTGKFVPRAYKRKTRVLLGGADSPRLPGSSSRIGELTILFVGRLVQRKGGDDLIRAFAEVKQACPQSRLVFVGDGPERRDLEALARSLRLEAVEFRGALTGGELEAAYVGSSVVALPSKDVKGDTATEGLGLALIEASMHGKPLVGTLHGGIPEVIKDGVNGLLVPEADPQKLATALIRLLTDGELRDRLGRGALRIAKDEFSWSAATDRLLASYAD